MTESYLQIEDQKRADEFVRYQMPLAPWLGQMQFYDDQWRLVEALAARVEVTSLPPLVPQEKLWLTRLGATVDELFSFERSTILARAASHVIAIKNKLTMGPEEAGAVVYARSAFLGKVLGWDEVGDAPVHLKRYFSARSQNHPAHVPLGGFILAQRLLHQEDVSVSSVARQWNDILDMDVTRVRRVVQGAMVEGSRSADRVDSFKRAYDTQ